MSLYSLLVRFVEALALPIITGRAVQKPHTHMQQSNLPDLLPKTPNKP